MKKILSFILILGLTCVGCLLAGCGEVADMVLTGGPAYEDVVTGNGSMTVKKGEYTYFASGYISGDDLGDSITNAKGSVTTAGLYRGKDVIVTETDTEGAETSSTAFEKELMVSKIVGFEDCGLYIFKDKIYFASPSIVKDSSGTRYDLATFYSCNLDGSNLKEFYQTQEWSSGKFTMTMIDSTVYLLIYNNSKIIKIDESKNVTTIAQGAQSAVLPLRESVAVATENPINSDLYVYYTLTTETTNSIDLGTTLYKQNIKTGEKTELFKENYITIKAISLVEGRLLYTRNISLANQNQLYFSNSLTETTFLDGEFQHAAQGTYTSVTLLGERSDVNLGICFIYDSKLWRRSLTDGTFTALTSSISSLLCAKDGYVFYVYSNALYMVDASATSPTAIKLSGSLTVNTTYVDADEEYLYFYGKIDNNYILHRVAYTGLTSSSTVTQTKMA